MKNLRNKDKDDGFLFTNALFQVYPFVLCVALSNENSELPKMDIISMMTIICKYGKLYRILKIPNVSRDFGVPVF